MTDIVNYCENTAEHNGRPKQAEPPSLICRRCEDQLHHHLGTIPDLFALLPTFLEHGTTEGNPESKATKRPVAAAPMRLEIIDLLDTRLGRKWQGTAAAHDRRGIAGDLQAHAERLIEERKLTSPHDHRNITAACKLLDRHRLWLAEQPDWIGYLCADLKTIHRQLSDAVGDYQRPPVGRCHIVPDDTETACGGNLYANQYGGVRCGRCKATWDADHLRQLGLAQAAALETA